MVRAVVPVLGSALHDTRGGGGRGVRGCVPTNSAQYSLGAISGPWGPQSFAGRGRVVAKGLVGALCMAVRGLHTWPLAFLDLAVATPVARSIAKLLPLSPTAIRLGVAWTGWFTTAVSYYAIAMVIAFDYCIQYLFPSRTPAPRPPSSARCCCT